MLHLIPKSTMLTPSRWSCFFPKCSNSRGTATLYPPLSRESWLALACCLKNGGFFLKHQCWLRPPDILLVLTVLVTVHTAGPGAETEGSSSLHQPQKTPLLHLTKQELMLLLWHLSEERDETSSPVSTHFAKPWNYAELRKRWLLYLHGQLQVLHSDIIAITFPNSGQSLSETIL